jgi:hypothetical protein
MAGRALPCARRQKTASRHLAERADVWDITVPEGHCFALGTPVLDVVVWCNPGETTEAEAIERYMRKHPEIATLPMAARTIHVVSWEGPTGV